jgi:hypothetical protein
MQRLQAEEDGRDGGQGHEQRHVAETEAETGSRDCGQITTKNHSKNDKNFKRKHMCNKKVKYPKREGGTITENNHNLFSDRNIKFSIKEQII